MTSREEDCCICLEDMKHEPHPQICGHWMHDSCARKQVDYTCPLCRAALYEPSEREKERMAVASYDAEFIKMVRHYTDKTTIKARKQAYLRLCS
jgi:hypothetical protein